MAMSAGTVACTSGLAKLIYDNWTNPAVCPGIGFSDPLSGPQAAALKALAYGVAKAVYDEITGHAVVSGASVT